MQGLIDHQSQSCTNTTTFATNSSGSLRVARGTGSQRGRVQMTAAEETLLDAGPLHLQKLLCCSGHSGVQTLAADAASGASHLARPWCAEQGEQAPLAASWQQLAQLQQPALGPCAWPPQAAGGWGSPRLGCVPWAPRHGSQLHPLQTDRASQDNTRCAVQDFSQLQALTVMSGKTARRHSQQHSAGMSHLPDAAGCKSWPNRPQPPQQAPPRT